MKHFYYLLIILSFLSSCQKSDYVPSPKKKSLPEATQEGKNTIGCYVNGEVWTLKDKHMYNVVGATRDYDGTFILWAKLTDGSNGDSWLELTLGDLYGTGMYCLNNSLSNAFWEDENESVYSDSCSSWVEVAYLDTTSHIVSRFFGILFTQNDGNKIILSDGRFDVKYSQLVKL